MRYAIYEQQWALGADRQGYGQHRELFFAFWVVVLLARNIVDHRNLVEKDKQLGIINAISAIYDSTFLLHLDTLEIEGINMSPAIAKIFAEHSEAYDFMDTV